MKRAHIVVVCALAAAAPYVASGFSRTLQRDSSTIDVQMLGPPVGSTVPEFSLLDQNGRTRTLPSILGPKGAVLVFFRSADW